MNTRTDDGVKRGPGRPRKEETRQEQTQRRRKSRGGVIGRRLGVNESMLDFDNFRYRWINDSPARIFSKTKEDDWDIVRQDGAEVKDDSDVGAAVSQVVGTRPDGSPLVAYLCRKPKPWYEEDQKEKQAELDRQLEEMRRGNDRDGSSKSDYVPHGGISV